MTNFTVNLMILITASLSGMNCSLFNDTTRKSAVAYSFDPSEVGLLFGISLDLMTTNITAADGILFYVSNRPENDDFISLYMKKSNLCLKYKCGANFHILTLPVVNQFEWQTAKVLMKTSDVSLLLNGNIKNHNHGCNSITLKSPYYIGGIDNPISSEDVKKDTQGITKTFIGCLRNFKPIGQPTEPADETSDVIPCSSKVEEGTFFTGAGYVRISENFYVGSQFTIQMQIKPRNMSGLIMAIHRAEKYFLILQMVNGSIKFTVENGKGPVSTTYTPTSPYYFLDNQFHTITATKRSYINILAIDNEKVSAKEDVNSSGGLLTSIMTTKDPLYIGGYPPTLAASKGIETGANFLGCIKNVRINNENVYLSSYTAFGDVMFNVCPTN